MDEGYGHYEILAARRKIVARRKWCVFVLSGLSLVLSVFAGIFESEPWALQKVVIWAPDPALARELREQVRFEHPVSYVFYTSGLLASRIKRASYRVAEVAQVRKFAADRSAHVVVVPRRPAAQVSSAGTPRGFMLVDETGFVYAPVQELLPDVPVLAAFPTDVLAVGKYLPPAGMELYRQVISGLKKGRTHLAKADFSNLAMIVAFLRDGTKVKIGYCDNLERKFALAGLLDSLAKWKALCVSYIDVSVADRPFIMPAGSPPQALAAKADSPM